MTINELIQELRKLSRHDPYIVRPAAALAVEVLKKFIGELPLKAEDKQDLWGFVWDWIRASDDEDRDYIEKAIREVLEGPHGKVSVLDENKDGGWIRADDLDNLLERFEKSQHKENNHE